MAEPSSQAGWPASLGDLALCVSCTQMDSHTPGISAPIKAMSLHAVPLSEEKPNVEKVLLRPASLNARSVAAPPRYTHLERQIEVEGCDLTAGAR